MRHRHTAELEVLLIEKTYATTPRRAQVLAFILALICIACSAYFFYFGNEVAGGAFLLVITGGAIAALVYGRKGV